MAKTTSAIAFGARWLLMTQIEMRSVGQDRVLFASDEPWSDFWGEYYKFAATNVGQELKERVLHGNFEELCGTL